ncbi:hypothetical protein B0H14DRAFT_2560248 [Mycena olivaceomarginata]|nr:hypothetical protein B0H14DRAFT_2560248 [Mycena olivaceomarginata]
MCAGDTIRVPRGRGATGGGAQRSGGRGTMRTAGAVVADSKLMHDMKGTCEGTDWGHRMRTAQSARVPNMRREGGAPGGRRGEASRVYRTTGWALRPGGIFEAAVGGGRRALARGGLDRRHRGPGRAKHNIEPWQESPRATSKLEIEIATARSIAAPATGFASCKFGHCQNEYQLFLRTNFRTPEGQQQLLWKGLLRLEVQQGIATVYSTNGNGLAEGEGLATSRERRAAKGSWVARCKED